MSNPFSKGADRGWKERWTRLARFKIYLWSGHVPAKPARSYHHNDPKTVRGKLGGLISLKVTHVPRDRQADS